MSSIKAPRAGISIQETHFSTFLFSHSLRPRRLYLHRIFGSAANTWGVTILIFSAIANNFSISCIYQTCQLLVWSKPLAYGQCNLFIERHRFERHLGNHTYKYIVDITAGCCTMCGSLVNDMSNK